MFLSHDIKKFITYGIIRLFKNIEKYRKFACYLLLFSNLKIKFLYFFNKTNINFKTHVQGQIMLYSHLENYSILFRKNSSILFYLSNKTPKKQLFG